MTKPTAWMPMWWGDYLRDTSHLSTHQHGAYLLLIAHYWSTGRALPDDDLRLQNITRVPPHLWRVVKPTISAFFQIENGHWYHARIERELSVAFDNKAAARARGKRGAAVRWKDRASILAPSPVHCSSNGSSPPPIKNHDSEGANISTDAATPVDKPRPETIEERLLRLANAHRQKLLKP